MIPIITQAQLDAIWLPSDNVQPEKSKKAVKLAQELRIAEIWGQDLYEEVQAQLSSNTLTPENQTLIDKSLEVVAHWANYYIIAPSSNNVYNKGVLNPSANYGTDSDKADTNALKQDAYMLAGEYTEKLIKFLNDNQALYPLYKKQDDNNNILSPGFMFPPVKTDKAGRLQRRSKDSI